MFASPRITKIDLRRWLRILTLRLDEARLEIDDIVAELIIFCLDSLVALLERVVVTDLLLELLDVALFALAEGALVAG